MGISARELVAARRILAVQPHYDDNDLGAGGTLAALADAGAEVHYLTATDDLVGVLDQSLPDDEATRRLRAEQERAAAEIGVKGLHWLGLPDAGEYDYFTLRRGILLHVRRLRPDVLFTVDPWLPFEAHRDHLLVGRAVAEASMFHRFKRLATEPEVDAAYEPHEIRAVVFYFTRDANLVFDVSETRNRKHRAIDAYVSQLSPEALAGLHAGLEAMERRWAEPEPFSYGEALKALAPGRFHVNLLPVD